MCVISGFDVSIQNVIINNYIKTHSRICILLADNLNPPSISMFSSPGSQKLLHTLIFLNDDVTPGVNVYIIKVSIPL